MTNYGTDYGMGTTNIDHETGIRYGVIHHHDVLQAWFESSETDYGEPTCPTCGTEMSPSDEKDFICPDCNVARWGDDCFGDEPVSITLDDGEYLAEQSDTDIFIRKSPYFTYAQYCSPCAPGACYLRNPTDEQGPRAYCFAPDWFEAYEGDTGEYNGQKTSCPYPVYRVSDGVCIFRPSSMTDNQNKPR